jgi:hypothetical protein
MRIEKLPLAETENGRLPIKFRLGEAAGPDRLSRPCLAEA